MCIAKYTERKQKMKYSIQPVTVDDTDIFLLHLKGPKAYSALWDMLQYLRSKWKYTDEENPAWFEAYKKLYSIMKDNNINIEEEYL